jgi:hypothetical protein
MARKPAIPREMQKVCRRFDRWRKSHVGRAPIPERLWRAAVEAANQHGVCRTAQVLRLDYYKLRRLAHPANSSKEAAVPATSGSPFVELVAPVPAATGQLECVIEVEGPRGKLRIQWRGSAAPDLAGLSRSLLEVAL